MWNIKDISPNVINALVATEDERFYEHSGIDGWGVLRAVVKLGRDGGGSTITQQLAKNMLDRDRKISSCSVYRKTERMDHRHQTGTKFYQRGNPGPLSE